MGATFWGTRADEAISTGLHSQGCFWHLDRRLEELDRLPGHGFEGRLFKVARGIDARLKCDRHQTLCHGDFKAENMVFEASGDVSVYDFQYVGKGQPAKDLAYCLLCGAGGMEEAPRNKYLQHYLRELTCYLEAQGDVAPSMKELEDAYALSSCDLARWMAGWHGWASFRKIMLQRCTHTLDSIDRGQRWMSSEEYHEAVFSSFPFDVPELDTGENIS